MRYQGGVVGAKRFACILQLPRYNLFMFKQIADCIARDSSCLALRKIVNEQPECTNVTLKLTRDQITVASGLEAIITYINQVDAEGFLSAEDFIWLLRSARSCSTQSA